MNTLSATKCSGNGSYNNITVLGKDTFHVPLTIIYITVFIGGITGVIVMSFHLCKINTRSVTTAAVVNLIVLHSLFLLTVPFRIAYYFQHTWAFGMAFCRMVSAMIHIHMYLCFGFYVIILIIRYLAFFQQRDTMEFYRHLHAIAASVTIWVVVLLVVFPIFIIDYGMSKSYNKDECFQFQGELCNNYVANFNYLVIAIVLSVVSGLICCQIIILARVIRNSQGPLLAHQEFAAQMKSLFFIVIIITCYVPYNLFRIYYLYRIIAVPNPKLVGYNDLFLALTALSCFDLCAFSSRFIEACCRTCSRLPWVCCFS
ncbi:probable G-protein coupled receptor 141 [Latimeria chalumnae]|uniref:G protein-coupled receptor 141 n=1 Tax=Latimeria chalumnae TaxID=7897 RepID=H3A949_LATCH|nr:PREDICTED: probable G-protein coupled receptor 141 [Latimeria chalumnae]|eukprot:XP_006011864.1 PREDICTED: probable G-protein coupled receptor 141 [Latimeria chalumnae]